MNRMQSTGGGMEKEIASYSPRRKKEEREAKQEV